MAKFAPVCPIHVLSKLHPENSGDYHLLLAHDVAANAEAYKQWFGKLYSKTVIMDNSVIELGNAVDLDIIKSACIAVEATTVVLPDVLLDGKATVESCSRALMTWPQAFADIFGNTKYDSPMQRRGFMYVPQGKTIGEWAASAQALANHPDINFWGIPRNIVALHGSRRDAIEIAHALNPHRRIHMLGFSDNLCDDVVCARDRRVEGIDSAVPLRIQEPITFTSDPGKRGDWWDTVQHTPRMDENIATYKQWIRRV
jgi:hypothetical protein